MTRILVVDDNQGIRRMLARKLEKLGYQVTPAERGQQALDLLHAEPVDLVLLDQMMPDMDGLTTVKKIRLSQAHLPIIMITAHSSVELAVTFIKAGGTDFIEKPVDFDMLELKIRQALEIFETNQRLELARTERQQAQEALRQSERHLRLIFENAAIGITRLDLESRVIQTNPALQKMLGYSEAELIGMTIAEFSHAEDVTKSVSLFADLITGKHDSYRLQKRYLHRDGRVIWANLTVSLVRDQLDVPLYVIGLIEDITERRQAEEALRQSEEHLRQVIASISDHIYVTEVTPAGAYLNHYLSPHMAALTGYPAQSFMDDWTFWGRMIHPEDRERAAIQAARLAAGQDSEMEYRLIRADDTVIWVRDSARIERSETSTMIYGLISDITARKQSEQALIDSEQRHRDLFENSPVSLWEEDFSAIKQYMESLTAQGVVDFASYFDSHPEAVQHCFGLLKVINVNKATLSMVQADSKETMLQGFSRWEISQAEIDLFKDQLVTIGQGETTFEAEGYGRTVNGDMLLVKLHWSIAPGYEQSWARVLVSMTDLTEQRYMEQSLMAAQKLADLGTLAAGVAHEINSPLQVITGLCQSILRRLEQNRLEPDYCANKLEVIQRNGWRCAEIVRALKTYAHASTTELEAQDLGEIIHDTLLLTEHQLKNWSNISIVTELAAEMPRLVCDRNQISQVLINLLSNARDAMPSGGHIIIRTGADLPARRLWLQVVDNGSGIPEAVKARMFDPFFTTKAIGHGTGLGLSIINGIVGAHGGEIEVESEPGRGTTFTLFFPCVSDGQAVVASSLVNRNGRFDENNGSVLAGAPLNENSKMIGR